jgi:hypothetical protein
MQPLMILAAPMRRCFRTGIGHRGVEVAPDPVVEGISDTGA